MGAVFAIGFFMLLFFAGIVSLILGILGIFAFLKNRKEGKTSGVVLTIISVILLVIGIIVLLVPIGFFLMIMFMNILPSENYVETAIAIEEDGYQDTRFTAGGVVYEALGLPTYSVKGLTTPVFSYKTSGFWNGSQCGNYHLVENAQEFQLVCDDNGKLFCPVDDKERIYTYYTDTANMCYYYSNYENWEEMILLSEQMQSVLRSFLDKELKTLTKTKIISEEADEFLIQELSKDKLVYITDYRLAVIGDSLYYIYEGNRMDDGKIEYILAEFPEEIAQPLLAQHNKN